MNNYPSDEEVSKSYKQITTNPFDFNPFDLSFPVTHGYTVISSSTMSFRDHLFYKLLRGWNEERKKAGFKPITAKRLATAINSNPWLKNSTEELYNILTKCEKAGNYKFASFILFPKKKK